jgi:hypothetical protein
MFHLMSLQLWKVWASDPLFSWGWSLEFNRAVPAPPNYTRRQITIGLCCGNITDVLTPSFHNASHLQPQRNKVIKCKSVNSEGPLENLYIRNKKFSEELRAYFLLIQHRLHRTWHVHRMCSLLWEHVYWAMSCSSWGSRYTDRKAIS